jgi:hypothetical protein
MSTPQISETAVRNLDRHGDGWERMRDAVGSPGGWDLSRFAEVAGAR